MLLLRSRSGTRIRTQIAILLFLTGVASFGLVALFLLVLRATTANDFRVQIITNRVAPLLRTLDSLPHSSRALMVENLRDQKIQIDFGRSPPTSEDAQRRALPRLSEALTMALGERIKIPVAIEDSLGRLRLEAKMEDGQEFTLRLVQPDPPPMIFPIVPPLLIFVALSTALSLWVGLRIVAPLTRFAAAVESFDFDGRDAPLPEEGPAEIRKATGAFNRMRERILGLVGDRTRMMMAISHDLRTPLTRLRLRTEDIEDVELGNRMRRDVDAMENSITDAVASLRETIGHRNFELTDLASLVGTICDEFTDAGFTIEFETEERVAGWVRPLAVARAVSNLVQNASKFGTKISVQVSKPTSNMVRIEVVDNGPGIPAIDRQAVLEPFYRMDPARMSGEGFGLGLAIANDVARSHEGRLTLLDSQPNGLCARLELTISKRP